MTTRTSHPRHTAHWARIDLNPTAESTRAQDAPTAGESADIRIYDEIGSSFWGDSLSAKDLAASIDDLDVDTLNVYINSPGGDAWDGIAIMNALRRHRATVNVTVDALAASAASVIAMAGDRVTMNRGAELMIHDASGMAWGNAGLMRDTADVLDKLSDSYADAYAARAGGSREGWRAAMRAETWYTAEEAVEAGLADEWVDAPPTDAAATATAAFDRSGFRYRARAQAPSPVIHQLPASEPGDHTTTHQKKEIAVSENLMEGLRDRLGLADPDADDSTILAALDERLTAKAGLDPSSLPEGTALVDTAVLEEMRANAAAGREAMAAMDAKRRDEIVAEAVKEGRIAPASRQSWRDMADKDEEGTKALLASLAPNTIPVAELGDGRDKPVDEADALYAAAFGTTDKEIR